MHQFIITPDRGDSGLRRIDHGQRAKLARQEFQALLPRWIPGSPIRMEGGTDFAHQQRRHDNGSVFRRGTNSVQPLAKLCITHQSVSKTTFLLYPAAIGDIAAA